MDIFIDGSAAMVFIGCVGIALSLVSLIIGISSKIKYVKKRSALNKPPYITVSATVVEHQLTDSNLYKTVYEYSINNITYLYTGSISSSYNALQKIGEQNTLYYNERTGEVSMVETGEKAMASSIPIVVGGIFLVIGTVMLLL